MTCPNCGAIFDEGCRFCGACGTPLTIEKKGPHRVPILIMLVLSIIGTVLFFATGGKLVPDPGDLPQMDFGYDFGSDFFVDENGWLSANFYMLEDRTEINVPETVNGRTVTGIEDYAFSGLTEAIVIHLPNTVEEIGDNAFDCCDSLRAMDLPPALRKIGCEAFLFCTDLEAIRIPLCVEEIADDAFLGCESLSFIFYDGTIDQWKTIFPHDLPNETTVCCSDGNFHQAD